MWVPGSLFFLIPAAYIILRMLSPESMARPLPDRDLDVERTW